MGFFFGYLSATSTDDDPEELRRHQHYGRLDFVQIRNTILTRLDHEEKARKKEAREGHKASKDAQNLRGLRAKLHAKKRHNEKIQMRKQIKAHEERNVKTNDEKEPSEPMPAYLLDRNNPSNAKAISSQIKNKRAEKAARFQVPLPKVKGISEEEMFKVISTGKKTHQKSWKRMITKPTFVGPNFTRRDPKHERFIRPMGLRYKHAHVCHPELNVTVKLPILGVKKNPQNPLYTNLGVLTKGTVLEVNVSDMGLTTASGKVVWGRYAQVTNSPENDGCVNAVLLV
ncbi:ribosomal protein S8e [Colletotrichum lupini]|uniref:Ribosome biogenesis protein NSA2 homolog n=1 Tax=Colletotrichum lupini TaxID=145971 RepID=A0A9Q8T053_9PEZI|nr:ribosomal protein S8e [Colletotrichum lupini]UQC86761.1 ribosomal protein S8e [Colletotrichum lupini]